jgi:glycosyltransferase involved in cell wall biosynthesis
MVRNFRDMMESLGHEVRVYEGPKFSRFIKHPKKQSNPPSWDYHDPFWAEMNEKVIEAIGHSFNAGDYLGVIAGRAQEPIAKAFAGKLTPVEYGVGYEGTFSPFRVFESYAWMHTIYGYQQGAFAADGKFYDAVIPNSFAAEDFPEGDGKGDYLLYIGRLIERKGLQVVADLQKATGLPLVVAGSGDSSLLPPGTDYRGVVGPKERSALYGGARATLVPTLYVGPFEGVAVESQLCGTPVITTDWGAFVETVQPGSGYRCRTLQEFVDAAENAQYLDRHKIRKHALAQWSTDTVRFRYQNYFERLEGLKTNGWYNLRETEDAARNG